MSIDNELQVSAGKIILDKLIAALPAEYKLGHTIEQVAYRQGQLDMIRAIRHILGMRRQEKKDVI